MLRIGEDLHEFNSISCVNNNYSDFMMKYNSCFSGLGKLTDYKLKLHVDPNVPPVVQPMRRVPFNIREKVEKTLDDLLSLDIIEPVLGPTSWVSTPVFVPKPGTDDELRLCLDMRRANEAILRTRHPISTIDELLTDMNGADKVCNDRAVEIRNKPFIIK